MKKPPFSVKSTKSNQADPIYFKSYEEYSKTLRSWLVAYGMAVPAILLSNEKVLFAVASVLNYKFIVGLFFVGVLLQVLLATFNKWAMWLIYRGESDISFRGTKSYKFADIYSHQFRIDVFVDIATLSCYAWATLEIFLVFAEPKLIALP
jgi:hypothetical protein